MRNTRILITGAGGMLGKDIVAAFSRDTDFDVHMLVRSTQTSRPGVVVGDLRSRPFLKEAMRTIDPDVIIHCAAMVNVEQCEANKEAANEVNVEATSLLASHRNGKVRFVYVSTDSVFNGKKGNYTEEDEPHPLNYYATSKLSGELVTRRENPTSVIVRTNIFGYHVQRRSSLAEWALERLANREALDGFVDVRFNPLYTRQLADIIKDHFVTGASRGVWHVGSDQHISKYEFLVKLAKVFQYSQSLIRPASIEKAHFSVARPKNTTLNTTKLNGIVGDTPSLETGLVMFWEDYHDKVA